MRPRCDWCRDDKLYMRYHDEEWGKPLFDNQRLFEFLVLETAQAGLSWITILRRRENYRVAFDAFDVDMIASYDEKKRQSLLADSGIIRNRLKIDSAINNAGKIVDMRNSGTSLAEYFWRFVDGQPVQNHFSRLSDIPASTDVSKKMSRDMKQRGFSFTGPTICYAFMQATGMVNDHLTSCFRYDECAQWKS
ncbi:MAG: DNA-3-methyladenine glycosylase I [Gammaproteobacteria bacterium]|nr:DNA-3-methyladenine glycosylase I [Gammaproteobacteria bacterium]